MKAGNFHQGSRMVALAAALALCCLAAVTLSGAAHAALPRLKAVPDPVNGGHIADSQGREVILRGVNVNSLGEYWQGTSNKPVLPLDRRDPGRIARIGWNTVRLIVSWSKVEPHPGDYDEKYLKRVSTWIDRFERQGVYTIIDLHQDAWGATLAARPGETCPSGYEPAFGWDGAPGWATLDNGEPHCFISARELSPAVQAAWGNFFNDTPAAYGVGIQTRYVRMLRRLAREFAKDSAVAGIDIMNEPGQIGTIPATALSAFYARSVDAIRQGEKMGKGFRHLIFFEPSVLWSLIGSGAPPPFTNDRGIVYSPHLYGGSIGAEGPPSEASFQTALAEAATFGGAPVVTGEWGGNPARATGEPDDYFLAHQALQDKYGIGAMLWTWKQSCGDPHAATNDPGTSPPLPPWNVFRMDCSNGGNRIIGMDGKFVKDLRRGYVRRAPGRLVSSKWAPGTKTLIARGRGAKRRHGRLEIYTPVLDGRFSATGLKDFKSVQLGSGALVTFRPKGGKWTFRATFARGD